MHVAGIMRCASVLLDSRNKLNVRCDDRLTDEEVYDAPRALTKMPIRRDEYREGEKVDDCWTLNDSGESKAVIQSKNVRSKMVKPDGGDETFFSVVTKR